MKHLVSSFQQHLGERGVHFYDGNSCNFLPWGQVLRFVNSLPNEKSDTFSDRLVETLANYNPDTEFLAVHQNGELVSVELFSQQNHAGRL